MSVPWKSGPSGPRQQARMIPALQRLWHPTPTYSAPWQKLASDIPLSKTEKAGEKLDWRVTRMRLSKDKTSLIYNRFLTRHPGRNLRIPPGQPLSLGMGD
jgi:hypothetical protein